MRKADGLSRLISPLIFPFLLATVFLSATLLSEELAQGVKGGLRLAVGSILPSLFPFMILSDLIAALGKRETGGVLRPISRLFGIGSVGARAALVGSIAGAPIAASMLGVALDEGIISRDEVERTLAISSSPSLAFAVSGVGAAMWGDVQIGLMLFFSVILASFLYGILTRRSAGQESAPEVSPSFSLIASIERATFSSLRIIGVVTAFSVLSGLVARFSSVAPLVIPLLEVGNAASYLSECELPCAIALALTAFALGFSGISVHLQVRGAIGGRIRHSRFLFAKILIGLGSAAMFSLMNLL